MTFGQSKLPAAPDAAALGRQEAQHGAAFDVQHARERAKGIKQVPAARPIEAVAA